MMLVISESLSFELDGRWGSCRGVLAQEARPWRGRGACLERWQVLPAAGVASGRRRTTNIGMLNSIDFNRPTKTSTSHPDNSSQGRKSRCHSLPSSLQYMSHWLFSVVFCSSNSLYSVISNSLVDCPTALLPSTSVDCPSFCQNISLGGPHPLRRRS